MRRAATLIEALVAILLLTAVAALAAGALLAAQRTARGTAEILASRADLRAAAAIAARELRAASPLGDTIRLASDTAVEFFVPILTGVTCTAGAGASLTLAPQRARGGGVLTSLLTSPDTGDLAWVWSPDSVTGGSWRRFGIASFAAGGTCLAALAGAGGSPFSLALDASAGEIPAGALVQVVRRGRYSLYRSGDGKWYLGYRRCDARGASCRAVQPVAGPYRAHASGSSGLELRFVDAAGEALDPWSARTLTKRIELVVRSDTSATDRRAPNRVAGALDDSLVMAVGIRNAR